MRSESHEVELVGPAALIDREFRDTGRRLWALGLFVFAAYAIFISAEPFAESLVEIGRGRAIDEFLLVQWVAPLASESPEFLIAILFALRMRGSVGNRRADLVEGEPVDAAGRRHPDRLRDLRGGPARGCRSTRARRRS